MKTIKLFILIAIFFSSFSLVKSQKYGATKEDSLKCIQNLSLYSEFYKQKNYKDAANPWKSVFVNHLDRNAV